MLYAILMFFFSLDFHQFPNVNFQKRIEKILMDLKCKFIRDLNSYSLYINYVCAGKTDLLFDIELLFQGE